MEHVDTDERLASHRAGGSENSEFGIWNSQEEGERTVNDAVDNSKPEDWVRQRDGKYRLTVQRDGVSGRIITNTGRSRPVAGIRIVMVGAPKTGRLWTAFPVSDLFFHARDALG
jgi:hypothetical protein